MTPLLTLPEAAEMDDIEDVAEQMKLQANTGSRAKRNVGGGKGDGGKKFFGNGRKVPLWRSQLKGWRQSKKGKPK